MCAIFMSIVAVFSFVFCFIRIKHLLSFSYRIYSRSIDYLFRSFAYRNWIAQCVKFAIARANTCLHFGPTMRFSRSPILSSYFSPIQPNFSTILYKYTASNAKSYCLSLYIFEYLYIHILHVMHIYTCKYSTSTATHQYQLCRTVPTNGSLSLFLFFSCWLCVMKMEMYRACL